jgi:hypothetical protein
LAEDVILTFAVDASFERREVASETELSPTLKLSWAPAQGLGVYGSLGLTHHKIEKLDATTDPSFDVGLTWSW